jgi:hypothetical protein
MFGMLEIGFSRHAVTAPRRITAELEIFFKKLLCCASDPYIGAMTVKNMIPVHWNLAIQLPGRSIAPVGAMVSGTHPFYIHGFITVLSCSWHFA